MKGSLGCMFFGGSHNGHFRKQMERIIILVVVLILALGVCVPSAAVADIITGTEESDNLVGTNSNDEIYGLGGNDTLNGGWGDDTYIFSQGFGQDNLRENGYSTGDVIEFTADILPSDVFFTRSGDHLIISFYNSEDKITVWNYFHYDTRYHIEEIRFAPLTRDVLKDALLARAPTEGDDVIWGYHDEDDVIDGLGGDDTIYGLNGNDTLSGNTGADILYGQNGDDTLNGGEDNDKLYGNSGNDTLNGGAGDDLLYGYNGNDTLDGGIGNDILIGEAGSDTYIFSTGYGLDTVNEAGNYYTTDSILFTDEITPSNIVLSRNVDTLIINLSGTDDTLTVLNYFAVHRPIDEIRFADETVWMRPDVNATLSIESGTENDDVIRGYHDENDVIHGNGGNDTLYGYGGDDTLHGGTGNDVLYGNDGNDILNGDAGADILYGQNGDDVLNGGDDNDKLYGNSGNDILNGGAGDDIIYGYNGNDTLIGGAGNDTLMGEAGSDTYEFSPGFGSDTVNEAGNYYTTDLIVFTQGILPSDILLSRNTDQLIITVSSTDDTLTILNYFAVSNPIDEIRFADETVWVRADINDMLSIDAGTDGDDVIRGYHDENDVIEGNGGNDTLQGYGGNDTLHGGTGNDNLQGNDGNDILNGDAGADTLYGQNGDDILNGGDDNDKLYGNSGNDILNGDAGDDLLYGYNGNDLLIGGAGNDMLVGEQGSDTYLFSPGFGVDTINEVGNYYTTDVVKFTEEIIPSDILLSRNGNHLIIAISGTDDAITVLNYFAQNQPIDEIRFDDGTVWTRAEVNDLLPVDEPTEGDDYIQGFHDKDDVIDGLGGNDKIFGLNGNDTLSGGTGNDQLQGNDGNDTLNGDEGDDILYGQNGDDTLNGGAGSDKLYGNSGNDILNGNDGDDLIYGYNGNDIITGGNGNDTLVGEQGSDTYLFTYGFGVDTVNEAGNYYTTDVISFIGGITPSHILLSRDGDHLILKKSGMTDMITVLNYFGTANPIDEIRFEDGTAWIRADINEMLSIDAGTDNDDIIRGYHDEDDVIEGNGGNDTLHGYGGNDTLHGGTGNDNLQGNDGDDILNGDAGADILYGQNGNDILNGGDGNDKLYGNSGDDILNGGAGDDLIYGYNGNDILTGGPGNDTLLGEQGSDTYVFSTGFGIDTVNEAGNYYTTDIITFTEEISPADVLLRRNGDHLIMELSDTGDKVTVLNYFGQNDPIDEIRFEDGTAWTRPDVNDLLPEDTATYGDDVIQGYHDEDDVIDGLDGNDKLYGLDGNDTLIGGDGNDELYGNNGNDNLSGGNGTDILYGHNGDDVLNGGDDDDRLYGQAGNDVMNGGTGDDLLYGYNGNDTLSGGPGNDTLLGEQGSDTYVFFTGFGVDTVNEAGNYYTTDVVEFKNDLSPSDMELSRTGDNLIIERSGTTNSITILNYFGVADPIDEIRFEDGTTWVRADINEMLSIDPGTDADDVIHGYHDEDDVIEGGSGNDALYGYGGNDTLHGGDGNDQLHGNDGNDLLNGNEGADILYGHNGDDTLNGGDDDDRLYGQTGNDIINGDAGDDILYGYNGNDSLTGGTGNDMLIGEQGSDTYLFSDGFGADTVNEVGNYYTTDIISFDAEILPSYILLSRNADNLIIELSATTDSITVLNYFGVANPIDIIRFADGTDWQRIDVNGMLSIDPGTDDDDIIKGYHDEDDLIEGNNGNDKLYGYAGNDTLYGGAGNDELQGNDGDDLLNGDAGADTLYGQNGNDTLNGGEDNDRLYGNSGDDILNGESGDDLLYGYSGNDTLTGGAGNDILLGESGSDTYFFSPGFGSDTVNEAGNIYTTDRISFAADILASDLLLSQNGDNLIIEIANTDDMITVQNYFGDHAPVDEIRFIDETVWTQDDVVGILNQ